MHIHDLGKFGERVAAHRLKEIGYRIIERNWRCSAGEVDLIAVYEGCFVFVEVKTRTSDTYGSPEESITHNKRRKMLKTAQEYLTKKKKFDVEWRVDMVAIVCDRKGKVSRFDHYENALY